MIVFFGESFGCVCDADSSAAVFSGPACRCVYFGDVELFAHVFEVCADECRCCPDQQD